MWEVEYTDEFGEWWNQLNEDEQVSLAASVELLRQLGQKTYRGLTPIRSRDRVNMKELRTRHQGRPLRIVFAFDPSRCAIPLIGGDKTGDDRFHERMIPLADDLYDKHLDTLRREKVI